MKTKLVLTIFLSVFATSFLFAQNEEEEKSGGFKKENLFIGSSLNLGFSSGLFQIGANPEIGYSITKWLDAGISTNFNYTSYRYIGSSDRWFNYGAGSFVRIWPAKFMFLSAIPEYNWITITTKYTNGAPSFKEKFDAGSVLLGAGYGNRIVGRSYSYFAIMFDAVKNANSPYRDGENRALPIFRAGFAVYLNSNKNR